MALRENNQARQKLSATLTLWAKGDDDKPKELALPVEVDVAAFETTSLATLVRYLEQSAAGSTQNITFPFEEMHRWKWHQRVLTPIWVVVTAVTTITFTLLVRGQLLNLSFGLETATLAGVSVGGWIFLLSYWGLEAYRNRRHGELRRKVESVMRASR